MTAEQQPVSAAAAIVRRVVKKTLVLVVLGAAGALVLAHALGIRERIWFPAVSVLFGGALGLLNFRWLARAVERLYLRSGANTTASITAAEVITVLKLAVIFIVLFVVIKGGFVHLFGLIAGLSLCFLAILWEGLAAMVKKE